MARYLKTAAEANGTAKELMELVTSDCRTALGEERYRGKVAMLAARLVNYGVRCAPRAVQATVRLRAVQEAVKGLPVKVTMEKYVDEETGRVYNRLVTDAIVNEK